MSEESNHLNSHVSENIRKQRELRGWSQSELARRMNDEGWKKYSQMTVSRTEDASRALRLDEAAVLARVLGMPLESLLVPPRQLDIIRELEKDAATLKMEYNATVEAVRGLVGQREVLSTMLGLEDVRAESSELGVKRRLQAEEVLAKRTLRNAILQGFWENEVNNQGETKTAEMVEHYGSLWNYLLAATGLDEDA